MNEPVDFEELVRKDPFTPAQRLVALEALERIAVLRAELEMLAEKVARLAALERIAVLRAELEMLAEEAARELDKLNALERGYRAALQQ